MIFFFFSKFMEFWNHHNPIFTHFQTFQSPQTQKLTDACLRWVTPAPPASHLPVPSILCGWTHTLGSLSHPIPFSKTKRNVLGVPSVVAHSSTGSFFPVNDVTESGQNIFWLSIAHPGPFEFALSVVSNAVPGILRQVLSLGDRPARGAAEHEVSLRLTFWGSAKLFSKVVYRFTISPEMCWGSVFPTSLSTLIVYLLTLVILVGMKWYVSVV